MVQTMYANSDKVPKLRQNQQQPINSGNLTNKYLKLKFKLKKNRKLLSYVNPLETKMSLRLVFIHKPCLNQGTYTFFIVLKTYK